MATPSRGKKFEAQFRKDWASTAPDSMCYRLIDAQGGYFGIRNAGDVICYKYPNCFVIDCKSIQGNTIGFSGLSQLDEMLKYKGITGLYLGFIVWFIDHDKIIWIPSTTLEKIRNEGKKSYNIKMLDNPEYESLEIPSKKLRTFMTSDYSKLINYYKENKDESTN